MFTPIGLSQSAQMELQCNQLMQQYNDSLDLVTRQFKDQWTNFWDSTMSVSNMQSQLDTLAATSVIDQGIQTNALSAYFAKAIRLITFISTENSLAFNDAQLESTGAIQLNGIPYQRYLTPGWIYTIDPQTGRMIVSAPCQF